MRVRIERGERERKEFIKRSEGENRDRRKGKKER